MLFRSWQVYAASPLTPGQNLGGLAYAFKQYGTAFSDAGSGNGNGLFYALSPSLVASLSGSTSKVYDGGVSAVVDPAQLHVSGVMPGDTVNLASTGPAVYASREVGSGKPVTLAGVGVATASEGTIPVFGYQIGRAHV